MRRIPRYGAEKHHSHEKNIDVWRNFSKRKRFTPVEQYWTLADTESVEFESMSALLRSSEQYHGVNDSEDKIAKLKGMHPEGACFHLGDWCTVVGSERPCPSGGIVYIDTMHQPDQLRAKASTMLAAAMRNCGPRTLICLNLCAVNPLRGHKELSFDKFWVNLSKQLDGPSRSRWREVLDGDGNSDFKSKKTNITQMVCLFFWRPV